MPAQDLPGGRLGRAGEVVRADVSGVDRSSRSNRSMVDHLAEPRALHLVLAEDYPWLQALAAPTHGPGHLHPGPGGCHGRRHRAGGVVIAASLERHGPLVSAPPPELKERLDAAGVPTADQALVRLLVGGQSPGADGAGSARRDGPGVRSAHDWLGVVAPVDRGRALAELAQRYLAGHGPADERDLARWSGLTLGDVRGRAARHRWGAGRPPGRAGGAGRDDPPAAGPGRPGTPAPRALRPAAAGLALAPGHRGVPAGVVTTNGIFRAVALVGGRAVGTWTSGRGPIARAPGEDPSRRPGRPAGRGPGRGRFLDRPGSSRWRWSARGPVGPVARMRVRDAVRLIPKVHDPCPPVAPPRRPRAAVAMSMSFFVGRFGVHDNEFTSWPRSPRPPWPASPTSPATGGTGCRPRR